MEQQRKFVPNKTLFSRLAPLELFQVLLTCLVDLPPWESQRKNPSIFMGDSSCKLVCTRALIGIGGLWRLPPCCCRHLKEPTMCGWGFINIYWPRKRSSRWHHSEDYCWWVRLCAHNSIGFVKRKYKKLARADMKHRFNEHWETDKATERRNRDSILEQTLHFCFENLLKLQLTQLCFVCLNLRRDGQETCIAFRSTLFPL